MDKRSLGLFLGLSAGLILASNGQAQVPVIDNANLTQAQQTASNTRQILTTDQSILSNVQKTLQAVTGDRSSLAQGSLAQMALGGGFSMGQAPSLGSVISGGPLSFAGLSGNSQSIISTLISGLQLIKSLTGQTTALPADQAFTNSSNTTATIVGLINSTQGTVTSASNSYTTCARSIGSSPDVKGSIDQNSQIQAQNGQSIVQLNGTVNTAAAAANQANLDRIAAMSAAARAMQFKPYGQ
jgi:Type IV secretion system proteins